MSTDTTLRISSDSLEKTELIAARIGSRLRGGESIVLSSDLGGGKTAFVRGLAKGMGSTNHVASPTFTIEREYHAYEKNLTIYHYDFYRLHAAGIILNELVDTSADPGAIIVVEWGRIVDSVLPNERINVTIEHSGENSRNFIIQYPPQFQYLMTTVISMKDEL